MDQEKRIHTHICMNMYAYGEEKIKYTAKCQLTMSHDEQFSLFYYPNFSVISTCYL